MTASVSCWGLNTDTVSGPVISSWNTLSLNEPFGVDGDYQLQPVMPADQAHGSVIYTVDALIFSWLRLTVTTKVANEAELHPVRIGNYQTLISNSEINERHAVRQAIHALASQCRHRKCDRTNGEWCRLNKEQGFLIAARANPILLVRYGQA